LFILEEHNNEIPEEQTVAVDHSPAASSSLRKTLLGKHL